MNYKNKIRNFLETCDGKVIDVINELYNQLISIDPNDQLDAFAFLCENFKTIESDGSNMIKENKRLNKYIDSSFDRLDKKSINDLIEETIRDAVQKGVDANDLYHSLWELLQSNKICETKTDKVLALFYILDNDLLPYCKLEIGLSMDNKKYKETISNFNDNLIKEIDYIIDFDFEQKTQESSLLLERLFSVSEKEQQIVLLSFIIENEIEKTKNKINSFINRL